MMFIMMMIMMVIIIRSNLKSLQGDFVLKESFFYTYDVHDVDLMGLVVVEGVYILG